MYRHPSNQNIGLEKLNEWLRYDENTGKFYWRKQTISGRFAGSLAGCHGKRHIRIFIQGQTMLAHRAVWLLKTGSLPDGDIDHINGDGHDNRFENLRVVSHAQNMMNKKIYKSNRTGCKGVQRRSESGKYRAVISCNGKRIALGSYRVLEDAIAAYRAAENIYHGEFARRM